MKRFIHTQTRKAVTATAGVQAIIESPVGAFKVMNLNHWWFFNPDNPNNYLVTDDDGNYIFEIKEPRLLNRLRNTGIFKNLQRLIQIPPNAQNEDNPLLPAKENHIGRVEYFPTWFFCETCERFKTIGEWWNSWVDVLRNDEGINDSDRIRERFFYDTKHSGRPNCSHCYKDNLLRGSSKRKYHKLEQVRFVFVSPDGDIKDIDWTKWITARRLEAEDAEEETEGLESGRYVLGQNPCCKNVSLKYIRSTKLSDLAGITIECENCNRKRTLAGFFHLRKKKGTITDSQQNTYTVYYKPLIRTSNSIYYPIVMNSLFIPQPEIPLSHSQIQAILTAYSSGRTPEEIASFYVFNLKDVKAVLGEGVYLTETEFRKNEYQFLLNSEGFKSDEKDLVLEDISLNDSLKNFGFERIVKLKRLKMTSVQIGYTRLSPMDRDTFSKSNTTYKYIRFDNKQVPLKAKFTVDKPHETDYLAGVENFGEGIFIKWVDEKMKKFIDDYMKNERSQKDIQTLYQRVQENEMVNNSKFTNETHLAKFLFIHSFSHLIIKELEFLCGYPSSSLLERIYCDSDTMNGLLIYTIAGSEGSFGGLIKQADSENFSKILKSALLRARDCSSDPICYESDGQGVGGLNYAACYSCLLISETSCEELNCFLDRRVLKFFENFS
ncbi:MAG: DUF1998 domain-containing protein [Flavobacteriales bacterium]|nr:DUF1998 domain-containing protein [Flavobacteriales bacterium]